MHKKDQVLPHLVSGLDQSYLIRCPDAANTIFQRPLIGEGIVLSPRVAL